MASLNRVTLIGNLGRDPQVRYTQDGLAIANVSLATTVSWKDKKSGERRDDTEWHRAVLYGRTAEIAAEFLKKGSPIYIEGRLRTRKWQDKEGQERYTTEIEASEMQMLGGRSGSAPSDDSMPTGEPRSQREAEKRPAPFDDMPDDFPF